MKKLIYIFPLICLIVSSCKKDKGIDEIITFEKALLNGSSQKGPFVNGSSLTLFELNGDFSQTGKSFNTQILDNLGSFSLANLSLLNSYAKLKADGFYFNEVTNTNSVAPISLYALSDISDKTTVNVNLLSTLEVSRIEYLISTGLDFSSAKRQAQREVLSIFFISKPTISESELLDISQNGDDNAILLASSLILQGFRSESELTQLMGDISTDLRTDGVLNSSNLGSALINHSKLLNLTSIRSNIENKYNSLGITTTISNFEKYINQFNDSSNYTVTNNIQYPFIVNGKQNLLNDSNFVAISATQYSIGAYLPIGTHLRIYISRVPGSLGGGFGAFTMQNIGWTYNNTSCCWNFEASGNNQTVDIPVMFTTQDSLNVYYYENHSTTPTKTKLIHN